MDSTMRPRIVVALLLRHGFLVKTRTFKRPNYIGDPINAVRILNEKEIDELAIFDISAQQQGGPDFALINDIASEAFMPLTYGGGIASLDQARRVFAAGVEKVSINQAAIATPRLIREIADASGSQSVIVSIDVQRTRTKESRVRSNGRMTRLDPSEWARSAESMGAGEIFLTSVDHEGTMSGMDLELISSISSEVSVPVVAHGGASNLLDLRSAIEAGASAAAAGSMFVYHGRNRAVLINYPEDEEVAGLLEPLAHD